MLRQDPRLPLGHDEEPHKWTVVRVAEPTVGKPLWRIYDEQGNRVKGIVSVSSGGRVPEGIAEIAVQVRFVMVEEAEFKEKGPPRQR